VLSPAVGATAALARLQVYVESKFSGNRYLFADRLERIAEQLFVREGAIGFGCIEMCDTEVMGGSNQTDHLGPVGRRAIARAHAHAAKAERRDLQTFT
jgi:hypothetical protein